MVLKPNHVLLLCLAVGIATPVVGAQQLSPHSPATASRPAKQKEGFVDYALNQVNPSNQDYGQCISDGRRILLSETIENVHFWSNVLSLSLLGCFFLVIVRQNKVHQRDELMNAESFCQIQNALLRAEAQVEEATKRNHELMESLAGASDPGSHPFQARNETSAVSPKKGSSEGVTGVPAAQPVPVNSGSAVSTISVGTEPAKQTKPVPQLGLFTSDVEQIAQVNALQQQIIRCQERVKNLSRQLNDAERRLQEEQQKNRSLKGE